MGILKRLSGEDDRLLILLRKLEGSGVADATAAGTSMVTAANAAAQTALLSAFTSGTKGLAPASGGGTTKFLRSDATWAEPSASGASPWDTETIDFGATPVSHADFTILDAAVSASSTVELTVSGADSTASNTAADHAAAAQFFAMSATPASGSFSLSIRALVGLVTGQFKVRYRVGT